MNLRARVSKLEAGAARDLWDLTLLTDERIRRAFEVLQRSRRGRAQPFA